MKSERHRKILEIINKNDIETQEELAAALIDAGFNVTQATVPTNRRKPRLRGVTSIQ